jgi:hypothetical protein
MMIMGKQWNYLLPGGKFHLRISIHQKASEQYAPNVAHGQLKPQKGIP